MAGPCARRSPRRNPLPTGKDEVAGAAPTEGSGTPTPTSAVAYAPTPYSAIEMAGTRARNSSYRNPSTVKRGNGEPADQTPGALIDSRGFYALTLILPLLLTPVESYSQSSRSFNQYQ